MIDGQSNGSGVAKAGPSRARARPKQHVRVTQSRVKRVRAQGQWASVQQVPGQYQ